MSFPAPSRALALVFLCFLPLLLTAEASATSPKEATPTEPLFDGLGSFHRKVTTSSPDAQRYCDQGLCFLFGFNHDEAIRSFQQAIVFDPDCPLARWGIAFANGPHINNADISKEQSEAAWKALQEAQRHSANASPVERDLIEAVGKRYTSPPPSDRKPLDQAFANAMREVWHRHPDDADVGALFAESLMDLRPWDFWTTDGKPQPGTDELIKTLEEVRRLAPDQPLALHLTIHTFEASPHPEQADSAGDRLRNLQPGLGHMVHMPSHLDVRLGRWAEAIETNQKAIEADRKYRERSPKQGFYRLYMAHNHAMLMYAAIMRGQGKLAYDTITTAAKAMPATWVKENPGLADMFAAVPIEVLMRFGRWDDVLAAPEFPDFLPISRALRHAARGVAYAAQGDVAKAQTEQDEFAKCQTKVAKDARMGTNKGPDVLAVAEHLLRGEILYRDGKAEQGIAEMRTAVEKEDKLHYDEPPDWIHPVRHALGATLLQENRAQEAEQVYRDDLKKLPNDGWALYGLGQALRLQGKTAEAEQVEAQFRQAWKDADVKITSSCFCQPGK